jgi:hypothetical protein
MNARRVGIWWLTLSVGVVLAIVAGIALYGQTVLTGASSDAATVTASTTNGAAANVAAADRARSAAAAAAAVVAEAAARELAGRKAALTASLDTLAAANAAPDFAVAVLDHQTGTSYTFGADEAFETASVVKVEILAALLLQARADGRSLTANEQSLAKVMIRQSDNDAATALWWKIGEASGLSDANDTLGLTETVPGTGGYWGLTKTTVSDQVKLLDAIADPTGPLGDSNQLILDLMGSVVDSQDWGVSAASGPGESTALKNGWVTLDSQGGQWAVNSVGRITGTDTDVTLAVMTRGHSTLSLGIAFVENITKLTRTNLAW